MKNSYYISRNYRSKFDAAGKAKTDCETVLSQLGFKNLGFKQTSFSNSAIGTLISFLGITRGLIKLPRRSILFTQYPLNKFYQYIQYIAKLKKCKIIAIVHDVKSLKGRTKNQTKELSVLAGSNAMIVHNSSMKNWFRQQGFNMPIQELEIFDYLPENPTLDKSGSMKENGLFELVYAGGLWPKKNRFLYQLDSIDNDNFRVKLYGTGFDKDKLQTENSIIDYQGMFPSNEIANHISGSFGLVWDGSSIKECEGQYGQYLRFNNPHKTSLYLLCGLPIIIWDQAALSDFVKKYEVGIGISSLEELNHALTQIDSEKYNTMIRNVNSVRQKLMRGGFLETAVNKILSFLHDQ